MYRFHRWLLHIRHAFFELWSHTEIASLLIQLPFSDRTKTDFHMMWVVRFGVKCNRAESSRCVHVVDFLFLEQSIDVIYNLVMILLVSLFCCSPISTIGGWIVFIEIWTLIVINLGFIIIKHDFLEVNFLGLSLCQISYYLVFCMLVPFFMQKSLGEPLS